MTQRLLSADFSEAQLLQAWQQRRRPAWPEDFAATMADPLLASLVRLQAALIARGAEPGQTRQRPTVERPEPPPADEAAPTAPSRHAPIARRAARAQAPLFDRKRAAAGERDDEE